MALGTIGLVEATCSEARRWRRPRIALGLAAGLRRLSRGLRRVRGLVQLLLHLVHNGAQLLDLFLLFCNLLFERRDIGGGFRNLSTSCPPRFAKKQVWRAQLRPLHLR